MSNKYPVQVRMREMSKQEEILMRKKLEIERKMKQQQQYGGRKSDTVVPKNPPRKSPEPISPSEAGLSPALNKFNNDGSFLEQFKKIASDKTEVKEEKYSTSNKSKSSGPGTNKLKAYCQSVPKQTDPAYTYFGQETESPPCPDEVKVHRSSGQMVDSLPYIEDVKTEDVKNETENPDWFKDALKRAQAKAKELSEAPTG